MPYFHLLKFLFELIVGTLFFIHKEKPRDKFGLRLAIGSVVAFAICAANDQLVVWIGVQDLAIVEVGRYLIAFSAVVLLFWFSYQVTISQALFFGCSGYALQNVAYYCFIIAVALLYETWAFDNIRIVEMVTYILVYAIAMFATRGLRSRGSASIENKSVMMVAVLTLFFTVVLSTQVPLGGAENILYYMYSLFGVLVVLFLQYGVLEKSILKREKHLVEQLLYMESKQHRISEDTITMINLKCHDLKHQVHALCEERGVETAVLEEIKKSISVYDSMVETGNDALNIIMTEKSLSCEKQNIVFSYILDGRLFDFMAPADIYSLFGNALDNAIESVRGEQECNRFISLKAGRQGNLIVLRVENYCGHELMFESGLPLTTKQMEPGYHGYGVKSICFLAEKYGGYAKMRLEEECFQLVVVLPEHIAA